MITIPPKCFAVNCKLFWQPLRYAVTTFSSETIIFFMQLHLPYFLVALFICICSLETFWIDLFHAAAVMELFRINFVFFWEDGT